mgnify:FL=1
MENYEKYVGMIFDGRYRIQRIIGLGGMAVVFEAEDLLMHRTVAVKMLKEGVGDDATSVKRFINESKAVSMLSHPNIVSIYDVSVREDLKYIVMEHIRGITLKNYMSRKGKLPVREAVSFTEQILRALDHAHSKGIIHRDIKPQNIMLLKNGMIKVADFGIAKLPSAETVTVTDKAIGTVYYISPEQASGKPIDPRSDLYSVGVMLYEMVTGTLPFSADSPVSVALMQIHNTPRPPRALCPELPLGLQQIILRAMEKDPDRRYQSAREMLRHIVALKNNPDTIFNLSGAQKEEEEEDPMPMRKRKEKATMLPIITGVLTAFLLVGAVTGFYIMSRVIKAQKADAAQTIKVENFVGQVYNEEMQASMPAEYHVTVEYRYDEESEPDTVLEQDPKPGEQRNVIAGKQYCELTLTLSRGAQSFALENYAILDARMVSLEMERLGLKSTVTEEYNDTVLEGYVIRTEPAAGETVTSGDMITLVVSKGQKVEYVSVPDFRGMARADALRLLYSTPLSLGKVTYVKSELEEGSVVSQSRPVGTQVPSGAAVDFEVSAGSQYDDASGQDD